MHVTCKYECHTCWYSLRCVQGVPLPPTVLPTSTHILYILSASAFLGPTPGREPGAPRTRPALALPRSLCALPRVPYVPCQASRPFHGTRPHWLTSILYVVSVRTGLHCDRTGRHRYKFYFGQRISSDLACSTRLVWIHWRNGAFMLRLNSSFRCIHITGRADYAGLPQTAAFSRGCQLATSRGGIQSLMGFGYVHIQHNEQGFVRGGRAAPTYNITHPPRGAAQNPSLYQPLSFNTFFHHWVPASAGIGLPTRYKDYSREARPE